MQRLLAALAIALVMAIAYAAPVLADDDDDSDRYTPITDCGTVIDQPGHYRLMNNLVDCDVPDSLFGRPIEYGVNIASDDVVLDLDGYTISCLPPVGEEDFFTFGVFTEAFTARNQVRGGTITGCNVGIEINQNHGTSVKHMTLTGNDVGIEVLAGSNADIKRNTIKGNDGDGIVATSFFFDYIGPGTGHRFHKNRIVDNSFAGIFANGIEDGVISCNRIDRNLDGIDLVTIGPAIPLRNKFRGNVVNDNYSVGIAAIGDE